ncbi:MAG TPA: phosphodiesterase [Pseudomonadales bacterium]|nr:phosphodiesterase [Pseudomonadales bacterium]
MPRSLSHAIAFMLAIGCSYAWSEEITTPTPVGQQGADKGDVSRPSKGMSKASVQARFGKPEKESGPVGQPPITRWDYADYSVFFEYDHVIHSVMHR